VRKQGRYPIGPQRSGQMLCLDTETEPQADAQEERSPMLPQRGALKHITACCQSSRNIWVSRGRLREFTQQLSIIGVDREYDRGKAKKAESDGEPKHSHGKSEMVFCYLLAHHTAVLV